MHKTKQNKSILHNISASSLPLRQSLKPSQVQDSLIQRLSISHLKKPAPQELPLLGLRLSEGVNNDSLNYQ